MVEHNLEMDKFNEKVNGIQEDLRKIKELVLSETERKKRIEDIKRRAESAKIELEKSINTLKDEAKKEAQALVESLNEIINLKLSIGNQSSGNGNSQESSGISGFFSKATDWIGNQWSDIWNPDKWKEEKGKNILRTAGFAATGIGAVALAYKGIKSIWGKFFSGAEEDEVEETEENGETEEELEEIEESEKKSKKMKKQKESFWNKRYGQTIKWLSFGAGAVGGGYFLGRYFNNAESSEDTVAKETVKEIEGVESDIENLKNQESECLKLSNTYIVNHKQNKKESSKILDEALKLQENNKTKIEEFLKSNVSEKLKEKVQKIKDNIDNHIRVITVMNEEILSKNNDNQQEKFGGQRSNNS